MFSGELRKALKQSKSVVTAIEHVKE